MKVPTDKPTDRLSLELGKEREREREGNEVRANIPVAVVHMRVTCYTQNERDVVVQQLQC